jgi:hypothetical protein
VTTPTSPWELADADPVGGATGWLAGHADLAALQAELATGEGRWIGTYNAPPYPRLRITDTSADLMLFRGPQDVTLSIDVLGDIDGRPGKAQLRRFAVAVIECLDQLTYVPEAGGCVFSLATVTGPYWSPLPPANQPRYVLSAQLRSRPVYRRSP